MEIGKIMRTDVETVKCNTPVLEIAKLVVEKNLRAVPVLDDNGDAQGIITEADLIYQVAHSVPPAHISIFGENIFLDDVFEATKANKKKLTAKIAGELMNDIVLTVRENSDVKDVATIMIEKGVDSILVMDEEEVRGIVTRFEIIRSLAMSQSMNEGEKEEKEEKEVKNE